MCFSPSTTIRVIVKNGGKLRTEGSLNIGLTAGSQTPNRGLAAAEKALERPEKFMKSALALAHLAELNGEVPIGAVLVSEDRIVGRGYNLRETRHRPTAHAELLAIESAARKLGRWRLENCILYVTLEPCLMCWGAIVLARIPQVVFGAKDPKAGVCGSILSLHEERRFNHHPKVSGGMLDAECGKILSDFFKRLRKEKKQSKK